MSLRMKVHFIEDDNVALASAVQLPLCKYFEQFDGNVKDFSHVRSYFDDLFSEDLIYCVDGQSMDRKAFIDMNKYLIQNRLIATLEDIHFSDDTHVEYTVNWSNDSISVVTHVIGLVDDQTSKIIKVEPCRETSGVFANMNGSRWKKVIALQVDRKILGASQWALAQKKARSA
eukprot:scaffold1934_cov76-Cyclotella_meneghiniana.AAC.11